MASSTNRFLIAAAALNVLAALLHLGCIVFGAPWYRFMGAGEQMAQMAIKGDPYPTVVTLFIASVLLVWSLFALSGAGVIRKLPLVRLALCAISAVYLLRAISFAALTPYFPGNSTTFWLVSSGICFVLGTVHVVGLRQVWGRL